MQDMWYLTRNIALNVESVTFFNNLSLILDVLFLIKDQVLETAWRFSSAMWTILGFVCRQPSAYFGSERPEWEIYTGPCNIRIS